MINFEELLIHVEQWGTDRNFVVPENAKSQLLKLGEEVGELFKAELKDDLAERIDAVGDILVVMILYCKMKDLDIVYCLESAYEEIKDRTGEVINGSYIKNDDQLDLTDIA